MKDVQSCMTYRGIIPKFGNVSTLAHADKRSNQWYCFIWLDWLTVGAMQYLPEIDMECTYLYVVVDRDDFLCLDNHMVLLEITTERMEFTDMAGNSHLAGYARHIISVDHDPLWRSRRCRNSVNVLDDIPVSEGYFKDRPTCYLEVGYQLPLDLTFEEWISVQDKQYPLVNLGNTRPVLYDSSDYAKDYERARYWLPIWRRQIEMRGHIKHGAIQDEIEMAAAEYLELFQYTDMLNRDVPMLVHTHERVHRYLYEVFVAAAGGQLG